MVQVWIALVANLLHLTIPLHRSLVVTHFSLHWNLSLKLTRILQISEFEYNFTRKTMMIYDDDDDDNKDDNDDDDDDLSKFKVKGSLDGQCWQKIPECSRSKQCHHHHHHHHLFEGSQDDQSWQRTGQM